MDRSIAPPNRIERVVGWHPRLRRYMLLRYPLLWRLHLPTALWIGCGAWLVALCAAFLVPVSPERLWVPVQLSFLQFGLLLGIGSAAIAWAFQQWRYKLPYLSGPHQLGLCLLNALIFLAILSSLNIHAKVVAVRLANALSPQEYAVAQRLVPNRDFTMLRSSRPNCAWQLGAVSMAQAAALAERMALHVERCHEPKSNATGFFNVLNARDEPADALLSDRIATVAEQRALLARQDGLELPYLGQTVLVALAGAWVAVFWGLPQAQRRRIGFRAPRLRWPKVRTNLFAAYEARLLVNRPRTWAVEPHRMLLRGGLIALAYLPFWDKGSIESNLMVLAVGALMVFQCGRIMVRLRNYPISVDKASTRAWLMLCAAGFGLFPAASIAGGELDWSMSMAIGVIIFTVPIYAAGIAGATLPPVAALATFIASLIFFSMAVALGTAWGGWMLAGFGLLAACAWWPARRGRCPGRAHVLVAALSVAVLPALCGTVIDRFERSSVLPVALTMLGIWWIAFVLADGGARRLAQYRIGPKRR